MNSAAQWFAWTNANSGAIALIVSLWAAAMSWQALRQGSVFRMADRRTEAERAKNEAELWVRDLIDEPERMKNAWQAMHAATGNFYSGATLENNRKFDKLTAQVSALSKKLLDTPLRGEKSKLSEIEAAIVNFAHITAVAKSIRTGLEESEAKLDILRTERRDAHSLARRRGVATKHGDDGSGLA